MNTHDIELPPLPYGNPTYEFPDGAYDTEQMQDYARAAIEACRPQRGRQMTNTQFNALAELEALQAECDQLRAAIRRLCDIYVVDDYYMGALREERLVKAVERAINAARCIAGDEE